MKCAADCDREAERRNGLCAAHSRRLKRSGESFDRGPISPRKSTRFTNFEWLVAHVGHTSDECLIWPFGKFANGYGQVCINKVNKVASREMCRLAHGEPANPALEAAHGCGKGHEGCVNPRHLRWATKRENEADKGNYPRIAA